jgi:glycosyltransferase involved in cell wall biosynthesis
MMGKPCICSNLKVFNEVYGNHVDYFDLHNLSELIVLIKKFNTNPKLIKRKGEKGKEYILSKLSWNLSAIKIEEILKK